MYGTQRKHCLKNVNHISGGSRIFIGGAVQHISTASKNGEGRGNVTLAQSCSCVEPSLACATGPNSTHQRIM